MSLNRRAFIGATAGLTLGGQWAAPAFGQGAAMASALAAIRAYGEAHLRHFGLPGMTLGITAPGGSGQVLNFGYANAEARTPIAPDTLWQIGSISKAMTALVLHQLAAQGRLGLGDDITRLLPAVKLPPAHGITVQHLLDHVSGLPGNAPTFPAGGLSQGFRPGAHWHYSNTGYTILGEIAERTGGKPLAQLIETNILRRLGMTRSRGAIVAADRLAYAQGYGGADDTVPHVHGAPLAPAGWVDVTFGAGSVASTADEMLHFLRALNGLANGRGGLGLSAAQGLAFIRHAVPGGGPDMTYGNGLMHVGANRSLLHHTGGMVGFSSAFHLDPASGAGAFASANVGFGLEYRPRLLTAFAVEALTSAARGQPLPAPKPLTTPLPAATTASIVGRYAGPAGSFEVRPGSPLTIVAGGRSAPLQHWGGDSFRTLHPAFRRFGLLFERKSGKVTAAAWGPSSFVREGSGAQAARSDPALARLAGRFTNDSPWWGTSLIVERGGRLWLGTDGALHRLGDNLWRVGDEAWSPERLSFADFVDGQPQSVVLSGVPFERHDI